MYYFICNVVKGLIYLPKGQKVASLNATRTKFSGVSDLIFENIKLACASVSHLLAKIPGKMASWFA